MTATRKYDLYSDEFRSTSYETFARMRAEDPVFCQPGIDGETMIWFITRYEDVVAVLLDDELAFPLPIAVIAELLGIPIADRDRFRRWSNAMVTPALGPEAMAEFGAQMNEFVAYLHDLFARRRKEPGDDLVSALLQVRDGGDTPSDQELFSMVVLLIVAGHETTVSLIGNAVLALLRHPDQLAALCAEPALVPNAVEELVRYDGPVERTLNRWAATDVELGGQTIRRGESVIVILGAADHDPERFDAPDELDLTAERDARHLGFGRGSH